MAIVMRGYQGIFRVNDAGDNMRREQKIKAQRNKEKKSIARHLRLTAEVGSGQKADGRGGDSVKPRQQAAACGVAVGGSAVLKTVGITSLARPMFGPAVDARDADEVIDLRIIQLKIYLQDSGWFCPF
jgi:hypothetical protein